MPTHNHFELLRQFHANQSMWVARLATGLVHPRLPHRNLIQVETTMGMRPGAAGVIMLPLEGDTKSILDSHNQVLTWHRSNRSRDVLTWSMQPNPEIDLALLAQGYAGSFEPWWMMYDLAQPIAEPQHHVRPVTESDIRQMVESDIPYVIRDQVTANWALISAPGPPQVIWLAAIRNGEPVGHAIVNLTEDHAGLFNVGVSGKHRHRGVGTSITLAAMQVARDHGARTMNLNSTPAGKKLYERLGFHQFGTGHTWIRTGQRVYQTPRTDEQELIFAIGRGDLANITIDPVRHRSLQCQLSPQELAVRFGQRESLLEIIRQGATPEIISLWKMGLRDEAISAAGDPTARELLTGTRRAHPIHHAIEMGAGTLVIELIRAGANLTARDAEYNATPLDWAHACNKPTIARIVRQAGGQ